MNNNIICVGMDVHKSHFNLCCFDFETENFFCEVETKSDYKEIIKYLNKVKEIDGYQKATFKLAYEAGSLGYSLYRDLTKENLDCVIMAPTTMSKSIKDGHNKYDRRDARTIAKCLNNGTYSAVHVPDKQDEAIRDYIRCRDDIKDNFKCVKQELLAFILRKGFIYTETKHKWTLSFMNWLNELQFENETDKLILQEYLAEYYRLKDKIDEMDLKIKQMAHLDRYNDNTNKLICLKGIKEVTALSCVSEISDFNRFRSAKAFNAFLGLTSRENSSSDKRRQGSITKDGNTHLRKLLIEAAQAYSKGTIGYKSKDLKARQSGQSPEIIAYADKASIRLQKRYYHLISSGKNRNVAITAIARELSSFIWGMMTNHTYQEVKQH